MAAFQASTQYDDLNGTSAATLHARFSNLSTLAASLNVPDDQFPISVTISHIFTVNKTDPIEDERESPGVFIKITTIPRSEFGDLPVPEYLRSKAGERVTLNSYTKRFADLKSIFDWFKEFQTVLIARGFTQSDLDGIKNVVVKDISLD